MAATDCQKHIQDIDDQEIQIYIKLQGVKK